MKNIYLISSSLEIIQLLKNDPKLSVTLGDVRNLDSLKFQLLSIDEVIITILPEDYNSSDFSLLIYAISICKEKKICFLNNSKYHKDVISIDNYKVFKNLINIAAYRKHTLYLNNLPLLLEDVKGS